MDIKRFLISILISFLIVLSCFTGINASAEITPEQEILNYCLVQNSSYFEQGIPYQVSYFQNLNGWNNNKSKFDDFISKSIYPNRMYFTRILYNGNQKFFYIINYDEIIDTNVPKFSNAVVAYFSSSINGSIETMSLTVLELSGVNNYIPSFLATNYSGFTKAYISFSVNNQSVVLDDGVMYSALDDTKKGTGIIQGLKNILTGKFSLVDVLFNTDASLVDNLNLLGNSFNGWLNDLIDVNIDTSSDEYNQLLLDLENNTQNSAYINNVSQDTLNQIRNTYQNLKNTFDNSVSVYSDNDNNYKYTTNSSSSFNDYMNDNSTEDNSSVVNNYFNTYIVDDVSNDNGGGSSGSSGNSSGCNCNNSASASATIGDIIINNNIPSGSGSSSDVQDIDVDTSSFKKMIEDNKNFLDLVTSFINAWDTDIKVSIASLFVVIVMCRIFGR